ncbi:LysR family transcriptional regulator [Microbacterium sp. ISL-103]|uniref:LysR family transcriptional regulator n=1 Tax=Microbacterium sp. ISL-103 TaxID=2819156 RepID=UPI001BECEABF|nr:LysR family transcriptional regulator [Microbacterium sp. ISL-103]MBT2475810.1 LysR family transcriptional regulator [Microbacterium sp. ISL-103]
MSLTRLEYFVAVAEELSFTRAARRLHVSQPPLTQQIQRLESELGEKLFVRLPRRIDLTPAGIAVLHEARGILGRYSRLAGIATEAAAGHMETLEVGFVPSAIIGVVPQLLARAKAELPDVSIRVHELNIEEQIPMLRSGDLDLGFFRTLHPDPEFEGMELAADSYYVALPDSHPLSSQEAVEWSQIAEEYLITTDRSRAVIEFDSVVAACIANGFSPRIRAEAIEGYNLIALVAAGLGVAVIPGLARRSQQTGMTFKRLTPEVRAVPMRAVISPARTTSSADHLLRLATAE